MNTLKNIIRAAALSFGLTLGVSGCCHYVPLEVSVVNGRNEHPVPDVPVGTGYLYVLQIFHPDESHSVTNQYGKATLRICEEHLWNGVICIAPPDFHELKYRLDKPIGGVCTEPLSDTQVAKQVKAGVNPLHLTIKVLTSAQWDKKYGHDP